MPRDDNILPLSGPNLALYGSRKVKRAALTARERQSIFVPVTDKIKIQDEIFKVGVVVG